MELTPVFKRFRLWPAGYDAIGLKAPTGPKIDLQRPLIVADHLALFLLNRPKWKWGAC